MRVEELSGPELRHLLAGTAMAVAEGAGKGGPIEEIERLLRRCGELYRALKANEKHEQRQAALMAGVALSDGAADGKGEDGSRTPAPASTPGTAPH